MSTFLANVTMMGWSGAHLISVLGSKSTNARHIWSFFFFVIFLRIIYTTWLYIITGHFGRKFPLRWSKTLKWNNCSTTVIMSVYLKWEQNSDTFDPLVSMCIHLWYRFSRYINSIIIRQITYLIFTENLKYLLPLCSVQHFFSFLKCYQCV